MSNSVSDYISALLATDSLPAEIAHHRVIPEKSAAYGKNLRPWPKAVLDVLRRQGIDQLYSHQSKACDLIRSGRHVLAATPTASGKSLIYNLPVLERCLANPDTKALYLFPLKALAQDQKLALERLTAHWPEAAQIKTAIYDGDTSSHFRRKIRNNPPQVLFTNPEMLHLALLPFHENWGEFWAGLDFVVVDEVHTYRGLLGSHMAQLFTRLRRICKHYGSEPTFVMCSATIGNPAELAENLTGLSCELVTNSGAPQGKRHFVFLNPETSPATTAIKLLQSALARELRTIVYCQSRRMTELISMWVKEKAGPYTDRISAYRAGFLPEERRLIERRMEQSELLAVITTSALELGIDIGGLDLCILVGYPGTVMSFMQRGGRVGRQGQESAVLFVAQEDALDQHFIREPEDFFNRPPEQAVLNPTNPVILGRHLPCAAAELPIREDEPWFGPAKSIAEELVKSGELLRSECGRLYYSSRKQPQRYVDLRGAGTTHTIVDRQGNIIGSIDGMRAWHEAHPGAVYIHAGKTYQIEHIDEPTHTIYAFPAKTSYYTRVRSEKETSILEVKAQKRLHGCPVYFGRLRVTEQITGYERRCTRSGRLLGVTALDAPAFVFETEGLWFSIDEALQQKTNEALIHFMGSIHALEHAAIGILPLLVMCDRNDLGGISTPMHPQVGRPAVFIYDGLPGGAGLARAAFEKAQELLDQVYKAISGCPCELGCPSCVHSPKCGSGNRPIDKHGALFLSRHLATPQIVGSQGQGLLPEPGGEPDAALAVEKHEDLMSEINHNQPSPLPAQPPITLEETSHSGLKPFEVLPVIMEEALSPQTYSFNPEEYLVLDVETQLSAAEVGGWHRADKMRVSVAVVYDSRTDEFKSYLEEDMPALLMLLASGPMVVGFNLKRFDFHVLSRYTPQGKSFFKKIPTLDMLELIQKQLGYRVSLDNLAQATLNASKSADGMQALKWWKEGKVSQICAYCQADVRLTRDLYLYGRTQAFCLFTNKAGQKVRVPATWAGPQAKT